MRIVCYEFLCMLLDHLQLHQRLGSRVSCRPAYAQPFLSAERRLRLPHTVCPGRPYWSSRCEPRWSSRRRRGAPIGTACDARVELISRELRLAAHAVTSCMYSLGPDDPANGRDRHTPCMGPLSGAALAARMLRLAVSLPSGSALHAAVEVHVATRLRTATGW